MSDSRSAIYDDERDWARLVKLHNLSGVGDCYSDDADFAQAAVKMGLSGVQVQKYIEAAREAKRLTNQAKAIMKPFEDLKIALQKI